MDSTRAVAEDALRVAADLWNSTGLTLMFNELVREVWAKNLARHDPDYLGDNARTLGFASSENLAERVERRIRGHEFESVTWKIDGLTVSKPQGALRLTLGSDVFFVMKAPMGCRREPEFESLVSWDAESSTRRSIAESNTLSLGGFKTSATNQDPLVPLKFDEGAQSVTSFMIVWAGEATSSLTAGWLTVPVMGEVPFAAVCRLWWDESPKGTRLTTESVFDGPSFDAKPSLRPTLTLKQRDKNLGRA